MLIAEDAIIPGSYRRFTSIVECKPELQQLHGLWDGLRGGRLMPSRRDFDPVQIPTLLKHLILIDVFIGLPREKRFRVRLQGTGQVNYQGFDWTGFYIHEKTDPVSADRLSAVGDLIVAGQIPFMSTGRLYWLPDKPFYNFETVLLPLSDDDMVVNMILGLTLFS